MILIIGLGNPGDKYQKTRHNLGFMVLEKIAKIKEIFFRLEPDFKARFADMGNWENRIKLVQPQNYMNQSGPVIKNIKNFYKIDSEDIWVIYDEVDLDLGKVRICLGGSSAGHKGAQSIIDSIGDDFWRIRIGIGRNLNFPTEKWVLENFSPSEEQHKALIIDKTAQFLLNSISQGLKEQTINIKLVGAKSVSTTKE